MARGTAACTAALAIDPLEPGAHLTRGRQDLLWVTTFPGASEAAAAGPQAGAHGILAYMPDGHKAASHCQARPGELRRGTWMPHRRWTRCFRCNSAPTGGVVNMHVQHAGSDDAQQSVCTSNCRPNIPQRTSTSAVAMANSLMPAVLAQTARNVS